jgi:uncharacterized protein
MSASSYSLKIDAYSHINPPKFVKYLEKLDKKAVDEKITPARALYDLDLRFQIMDRYDSLVQVLTLGWPPVEDVGSPKVSLDLAKRANDEMAELVAKYPERFIAAIASLPMNNMDAAMKELDRAIVDLKFRGAYIHTPINEKPIDLPEYLPLYEKMAGYNLPIFIHPMRPLDYPHYKGEARTPYALYGHFGWPFETTFAMCRLALGGIMEKYPNLKVVTHHGGGMIPYFSERLREFRDNGEVFENIKSVPKKHPIEYFKMFYADTAIHGNPTALMCARAFFGIDHILFGCDFPLGDSQNGFRNYRQTVNAINQMDISEEEKKKIFEDNARNLMRLPI